MTKVKLRKLVLIGVLVLAIIFMNLPAAYTYFYHDITGAPTAVNGNINLSAVSPADGNIYLDGQWDFYWNRFIITEPEKLSNRDRLISVPDSWSKYKINKERLPAEGFGSYKLTLTGFKYDNSVAIFVPDFGEAYRVFIDGQLVAKSGTVSKYVDKIFTVPKADLYPITLSHTRHEVVIEVSTTRFSGLYMTPILSDYSRTVNKNSFRNMIRFILFGIALFSFFNLIGIYIMFVRRKIHSFWLPVMILFIIMRIMLTSEFYSIWQPVLFFSLSYESINQLMYFTTFVLKYLLIFLVEEQCGITFKKQEKIGFLIYYVLLYLIYLFIPQSIYNHYLSVLLPMLTYVLDIYMYNKVYSEWQSMDKYGMLIFGGAILSISGLTIDSYYINGKIYMNMSLAFLFLFTVFALIINFVYVMRSRDLHDNFTKSSLRLQLANNQIAMQKEYYSALNEQMNRVREIKHDIRHFIGAMSRLAEEDKFDELKDFLREYNEKTEMSKLPVFCQNVVANSIIGYYYLRAKENEIPFKSRCSIEREIAMSDSDLCIVLGNALENTIDACRQMDNSEKRFISIESVKINGQWLLKVKNSYNGRLKIKDGCYISTKESKSHGLGVQNIEKVVESYGGFVKVDYNEREFTLMVAVPEK